MGLGLLVQVTISQDYVKGAIKAYLDENFKLVVQASSRGPYYLFVGSLALAQWDSEEVQTSLCGFAMMCLGVVEIIAGFLANRQLSALREQFVSKDVAKRSSSRTTVTTAAPSAPRSSRRSSWSLEALTCHPTSSRLRSTPWTPTAAARSPGTSSKPGSGRLRAQTTSRLPLSSERVLQALCH